MKKFTAGAMYHDIAPNPNKARVIPLQQKGALKSTLISQHTKSNICLNTAEGSYIIPISDILRLESSSNYTLLFTISSEKYLVSKTMKVLIDLLPPRLFIRCHNSHFVNINQITSFMKGSLILSSKEEIPIARQKFKTVVSTITKSCISI